MVLSQGIFMWTIKALALTVQKLLARLKFFLKMVKLQGQGHRVKNNGTHGKVLSQGILMWNIKPLAFTVQKLLARLKFQREWQNDRMTEWRKWQNDRKDKNNMPPDLRSRGHKNAKIVGTITLTFAYTIKHVYLL